MESRQIPAESAWYKKAENLFLVIGFIWGTGFVFINPPVQVPDENHHWFRTFQIAEGTFVSPTHNNIVGGWIPKSIIGLSNSNLQQYRWPKERKRLEIRQLLDQFKEPLNRDEREFKKFRSVIYSPVSYVPAAIAFRLALLFEPPAIAFLYIGRLANLFCWLCLLYMSIRILPFFKWAFFLLALTPMSVFEAASLSADCITNGLAFMTIAYFLFLAFGDVEKIKQKHLWTLLLLTTGLSLSKNVFFPMCLLFFLIPAGRFRGSKSYILVFVSLLAVNILSVAFWNYLTSKSPIIFREGPDVQRQFFFILTHPLHYVFVLCKTLCGHAVHYYKTFIGCFGWMEFRLPRVHLLLWLCLLIGTSVVDGCAKINLDLKSKSIILVTMVANCLLIFTVLYLYWNEPASSNVIEGIQGRYFIPVGPLIFLLFCWPKVKFRIERISLFLALCTTVSLSASLYLIVAGYYLVV